ncbi:MAG TPA: oxaloacetate decarboxylase [Nitrososphaeraceae archaeon]|jgi:methylisocitrate lyase
MRNNNIKSLQTKIKDKDEFLILPGVFDALSAKIVEMVGFDAMFQTGYGSAATLLGMPDFGFLNAGETIDNARRIIRAVSLPVIVDVDTGYGNPLTVWRIVNDLLAYGASGIFLEDQLWPKRCGHMKGKDVIRTEEFLPKLKAALDARSGNEFIIVARTDARGPLGLDQAIERGKLYYKEGADVVFVEAPQSIEELKEIARKIPAPLVANMIENGVTPTLSALELKQIGYRMAVFPLSGLYAATYGMKRIFSDLKEKGTTKDCRNIMLDFTEFNQLVNLQKFMNMDQKYSDQSS